MTFHFLISGQLRTFKYVLFLYLKELSRLINIKLYIYTTNTEENIEEIKKDPLVMSIINDTTFIVNNINNTQRESNVIYQWYNIYSCFKLLELSNIVDDDIIIRIRPDINILIPPSEFIAILNKSSTFDGISIPNGYDICDKIFMNISKNPINDQLAIGKYKYMKSYCSLFNNVNFTNFSPIISEDILKSQLDSNNIDINRFDLQYMIYTKKCNIISITGDSGVGKTTRGGALKSLSPNNYMIFETDRYHKWERNNPNWLTITHLNPDANYLGKMLDDTYVLTLGDYVYQVDYDHSYGKFTDLKKIIPTENIILCGLHTLVYPEQRELIKLKIFIDVEPALKQQWKIKRDVEQRKYTYDRALELFKKREIDFTKFILPQRDFADIVIHYYLHNSKINCSLEIRSKHSDILYLFLNMVSIPTDKTVFILNENFNYNDVYMFMNTNYKECNYTHISQSFLGIIQCVVYIIISSEYKEIS